MRRWVPAFPLLLVILLVTLAARPAAGQSRDDFFDDTAVRNIDLVINSKDWAALKSNFESNTYYPCALTWNGLTVRNVGIRSRGSGTRSPVKPGLRVDFDRYSTSQTFVGMKSFVLDNLLQDRSMLKERISMQFFRRMGLPAPREAHVRLLINGQYVGLYAAVESIDKGFLGRTFGADADGGVENDGYLFEYDWLSEYRFEYLGDDLEAYAMFKPKTRETDPASKVWGPIQKMVKTINESPDPLFVEDVSQYLNLDLFVRHLGIENFLAELDGILGYAGLNNFYLYRFEDGTLSQFLPWDKDNTFFMIDYPIMQGVAENVLARRTFAEPRFRSAYLDTLLAAADSADEPEVGPDGERPEPGDAPTPGWLEREILREYDQVRTFAREDNLKPWTNEEFEEAIQQLLDFARQRPAFVRAEVTNARQSR
jgi:spore coat protein CotH